MMFAREPGRVRLWMLAIIAVILLVPVFFLSFCVGPPSYYRETYAPAGPARPLAIAGAIAPEKQVEPHTCGLHALSSVYRAYGLDPADLRLRFRTGVDKPFTNLIPSSRGTVHPDMLRVLSQDGFRAALLDTDRAETPARLAEHLDAGQLAIALIRVNELHWVVIAKHQDDRLVICDSLREDLYDEPLATYLRDCVHTLILVEPKSP